MIEISERVKGATSAGRLKAGMKDPGPRAWWDVRDSPAGRLHLRIPVKTPESTMFLGEVVFASWEYISLKQIKTLVPPLPRLQFQ